MASPVRFKFSVKGFNELRNSEGVQAHCLQQAQAIAARANAQTEGRFVADVREGKTRCHATVKPDEGSLGNLAAKDNLKKNVLVKARGW